MKEIKVAIIAKRDDVIWNIRSEFEKMQGYKLLIESADLNKAVEMITRLNPLITIIDLSEDIDAAFDVAARIAKDIPQTYISCTSTNSSQELIVRAMRLGIKDYLRYPIVASELEALITRSVQIHAQEVGPAAQGKIITVFSNKGGVGTTSLAINLGVGLAEVTKSKVVIVDLVAQHGDVSSFLNVTPTYTITNLIENFTRLDKTFLKSALTKHPSGVRILTEATQIEDADVITREQSTYIFNLLKEMFDYIVVDGGNEFNEQTLAAMDLSDKILLVALLDIPSIQNTKRCLDIFERLRYDESKVKLIINRYNSKHCEEKIGIEQVKKTVNHEIFWKLPNDYSSLIKSINRGEAILSVNKKSDISVSIVDLVKVLSNSACESGKISVAKNLFKKAANIFFKITKRSR